MTYLLLNGTSPHYKDESTIFWHDKDANINSCSDISEEL